MFKTIVQAFKVKEIRKRLIFTIVMLIIVRIGCQIPLPGTDPAVVKEVLGNMAGGAFGFFDALTGSSFSSMSIFALNITVYITASIIIQLLTIAIPKLEELQKEGEDGRQKIAKITRYLTVGLALVESTIMVIGFGNQGIFGSLSGGKYVWTIICDALVLTAGAVLVMWIGEQITEKGIGNGISIILFASIISRLPTAAYRIVNNLIAGSLHVVAFIGILIGVAVIIILIVFVSNAERRIPVQYAKRVVGRRMYGGQSTYLPMKVNMSGVMPIIFAQSIASLPATVASFLRTPQAGSFGARFLNFFDTDGIPYMIIYFLLIIAFGYFYATIQFNPIEVSNNLKKNGGYIPGFRPGKPTTDFISKVLNRVTLFGSLYLGIVAALPIAFSGVTKTAGISLGGTSIIIAVGVAIEIVQGLENQMIMRHYKGFLD